MFQLVTNLKMENVYMGKKTVGLTMKLKNYIMIKKKIVKMKTMQT